MAAKSQDKILFGAALVLLLASAGWALLQNSKIASFKAAPDTNVPQAAYVPTGTDAPRVSTRSWPQPPSQSRGIDWIYDVFTPPEIYYDEATKQFSVTPPVEKPIVVVKEVPFGLTLVSVKQDAYRLQLVGYVGAEGDYRGTFQNTITGDTIIGRAGKVIAALDLTIKTFEVKRNKIISKDSMPVYDTEATAVVVDTKTGEEIRLTNKARLIKGTPFATLKADGAADTVTHKAGEKFTVGDATYSVVNVTAEPPSVVVTKETAQSAVPETKTLTPAAPVDAVAPSAGEAAKPVEAPATTPFPFGS
ncbi:MAG: hypothetical protein ACAH89_01455 [Rariglobus sp.]